MALAAEAADAAIRHALGITPYSTFLVDGLLAIAVFSTLGLLLDIRTLQVHNRDSGLLGTVYRAGHMRLAVTFATTLVVVVVVVAVGIWQDVYLTGQTAQQRAQTASSTAQAVNSTIGGAKK